jgi:hypothetical protein
MARDKVKVWVRGADLEEAREVRDLMKELGVRRPRLGTDGDGARALADVTSCFVAGAVTLTTLTELWHNIRRNRRCREYVYVSEVGLTISRDCTIKDGRILVFWNEPDQRVEIHDVPSAIDITQIAETVVKSGADAVKAAAEALGAKVDGPFVGGDGDADDDRRL